MIDNLKQIKALKSIIDKKIDYIEIEPKSKNILNLVLFKLATIEIDEYNNTVDDFGLEAFSYRKIENE